jgi:hypothetical protein
MSTPKKPTPDKSKISKKPSVKFEISDEELDKASGGGLAANKQAASGVACENMKRGISVRQGGNC